MQSLGMRFGAHVNAHTELRRDGLRAADPDRQPRGDRPVAAHPRRLRAQRVVRSRRDRQGARRHPRGVAPRAGRRRADPGRAVSAPAQRLALRGPAADRQARDHPERQSRPAEAVLHGLVPPGPDGGGRRRRFQQGRRSRPRSGRTSARSRRPPSPRPRPTYTVPDQTGDGLFGDHRSRRPPTRASARRARWRRASR